MQSAFRSAAGLTCFGVEAGVYKDVQKVVLMLEQAVTMGA
jgi:hypothetical protein